MIIEVLQFVGLITGIVFGGMASIVAMIGDEDL